MINFSTLALVILLLGLIFMGLILLRGAKSTILLNQISKSINIVYTFFFFSNFRGGLLPPKVKERLRPCHVVVVVVVFLIVLTVGNLRIPKEKEERKREDADGF